MTETNSAARPAGPDLLPAPLTESIELARAAALRLDWQASARLWKDVLAQSPAHIQAYLGAATALRKSGRHGEAEDLLAQAAERFPDHEAIAVAYAWNATSRRDWPAAIQRWAEIRARFPDHPQLHRGMGQALRGAGRLVEMKTYLEALQALVEAEASKLSESKTLLDLAYDIARVPSDWPGLRLCAEQIIARGEPPDAVFLALSQSALHMGDHEAAEAATSQLLAANPKSTETLLLLVKLATERGDGEATLNHYAKLAALHPNNPQWRLKHAQLLNWMGRVDEAMDEAAEVLALRPHDPVARAFARSLGLAAAAPPGADPPGPSFGTLDPDRAARHEQQDLLARAPAVTGTARAVITADPRRDVIIPEEFESETAILIFAGVNDSLSMPLELFDHYLRPLDMLPIYLRDFNRLRYLKGIRSLADDYQGTLDELRRMLRERGIKRLYTLGNCTGGSAAIRYGIELGADCVAAFHTPTYCPDTQAANIQVGHRFLRTRLLAQVAEEMTDLKPFLERRAGGARIELFYDAVNLEDEKYAARIAHVPGVRLNPLPGKDAEHTLRRLVLSADNFSLWLAELLAAP